MSGSAGGGPLGGERFMGVDLTASPSRATAVCILSTGGEAVFHEARLNEEILELASTITPACIAIDAPLSSPTGGKGLRLCDREAIRVGIRIFPPFFGSMRALTARGLELSARLRGLGFEVIETFPSGAQKILGLWRCGERRAGSLSRGLRRLGLKLPKSLSLDMVDAATCAYVALLYKRGLCTILGDPSEGLLILPAKAARPTLQSLFTM
ncbi:MAG: DUF429 domain-containing protein [Nitrososphaerota archaeon]|nr:DUF429 domain-containing protein [Candidatus Calditenuaceae archaeon]MDW8073996.1 DUF429 domain-containing protein [Nitrososphaerota archaeon]